MNGDSILDAITERSRIVVVALLVLSVVVGAGVPMIGQSTGVEQFQSETDESAALDYSEANFSTGNENTTTAQILVEDENVLDRATLLSMLDYERALRSNATVEETLAANDSVVSLGHVVASASIREERSADLHIRQQALNATAASLERGLDTLARNPNASIEATFERVETNTSIQLTDADYRTFETSARHLRNATDNATVESAYQNGTRGVLVEEYDQLAADRNALADGIDPALEAQRDQLASLNESELQNVVATVLSENTTDSERVFRFLPDYYESGTTATNATLMVVTQQTDSVSFAPGEASAAIEDSQQAMAALTDTLDSRSAHVYGSGIVSTEITESMVDSIVLVGPLAAAFVLVVLVIVYRDVLDILLGLLGIGGVLLWTFGVMGWLGIDFSQPFIVVVVLLIGLSIDYSIHVVMRYREAQSNGDSPTRAMRVALGSVGIALVYVTATTIIGFLSNLSSPLSIFRDIGVVSAIGIASALIVFGVLIPAIKLELDTLLSAHGFDRAKTAFGADGSRVTRLLDVGGTLATKSPYIVITVAVVVSGVGIYGATQVDTSFSESDFLAEDPAQWQKDLPEPFAPGEYTAKSTMDRLNADFLRQDSTATILVRDDITDPSALDRLHAAEDNASTLSMTGTYASGEAAIESPLSVMAQTAAENESFATTFAAADTDGDGTPDQNVTAVYDALFDAAPEDAGNVLYRTADGEYEAFRMVVTVDGSTAGEDVREQMGWVAADLDGEGLEAIETGQIVINQITGEQLTETVFSSLLISLVAVLVFLSLVYRLTEGSASLGAVTIVPVAMTLTWVLGSMALLDIPFNIVTGLITSLTIGLGVDYSLHLSERFNQELAAREDIAEAIHESVVGTGGALLSSAATTASGFAVLLVAILPFLQSFGLITALTIVFAFLASVFVLPSLLVVWARLTGAGQPVTTDEPDDDQPPSPLEDDGATVPTRTLQDTFVHPGQSLEVTVALPEIEGRISVRETVPGEIEACVDVTPEPVAVDQRADRLTVLWDCAEGAEPPRVTYRTTISDETQDGEELAFEGIVVEHTDERAVEGEQTVTVLSDVFQRVVARGNPTDEDVRALANTNGDGVSAEEFDRLCRAWVRAD